MPQVSGIIAGLGRVRLTLEPTPQPSETGGSIIATAILTKDERGREQEPVSGQAIIFWLGPDEVHSHPTDDHGRASYTFAGLGLGAHAVSVQHGGLSVTFRHTFERKHPKLAVPNVRVEGDEGDYVVSVGPLLYEDGRFAANVMIRFLVSRLGRAGADVADRRTNAHGYAKYHLQFTEPEADVTVQGPGFEAERKNLYGPSKFKRPATTVPGRPATVQGRLRALFSGIAQGMRDRRR